MGVEKHKRPVLAPNSPLNFSLIEQDTGLKWLDDKPIYQKTVLVGLPNNNTVNTAHGITGLDHVVEIDQGSFNTGSNWVTLPATGSGGSLTNLIDVFFSSTNISVVSTGNWSGGTNAYVTFRYTKT